MQYPVSLPGPCSSRELAEADPPSLMTPCSGSPLFTSSLCSSKSTMGFYNRVPTLPWLPWKRQEETSQSGSLKVPTTKAITTKGCAFSLPAQTALWKLICKQVQKAQKPSVSSVGTPPTPNNYIWKFSSISSRNRGPLSGRLCLEHKGRMTTRT